MQKEQEQLNENAMDKIQLALDAIGLIPGAGEVADGLNTVISLARGNPLDALLSAISMVPAAGDAVGKGGKLVLKVLDPVMDLIKASKPAADIVKKLGPKKIEKAKDAFKLLKNFIVKNGDDIKEVFASVKNVDIDALSKITGIKVPKLARGKAEQVLKIVSSRLPENEIDAIFKFLSELPIGDEEGKEEVVSESIHHNSLLVAMGEPEWVNERFLQIGNEIQQIIEG